MTTSGHPLPVTLSPRLHAAHPDDAPLPVVDLLLAGCRVATFHDPREARVLALRLQDEDRPHGVLAGLTWTRAGRAVLADLPLVGVLLEATRGAAGCCPVCGSALEDLGAHGLGCGPCADREGEAINAAFAEEAA